MSDQSQFLVHAETQTMQLRLIIEAPAWSLRVLDVGLIRAGVKYKF